MKCYQCGEQIEARSTAYSFNYQTQGTKFYGLAWCEDCGAKVMDLLQKMKYEKPRVTK